MLEDVARSGGIRFTHSDNNLWFSFVRGTISLRISCRCVDSVSKGMSGRTGRELHPYVMGIHAAQRHMSTCVRCSAQPHAPDVKRQKECIDVQNDHIVRYYWKIYPLFRRRTFVNEDRESII
jgi:hypothetical protein